MKLFNNRLVRTGKIYVECLGKNCYRIKSKKGMKVYNIIYNGYTKKQAILSHKCYCGLEYCKIKVIEKKIMGV